MKRTENLLASGLIIGVVMSLQSGCAGTATVTQPTAQAASMQLEAAKKPSLKTPPLAGKVLETMNAGGYTYISLEKDGKKGWVALPVTEVAVGQEITVKVGLEMGIFSSKALHRSFDNIIFSPGLVTEDKNQVTQGQPGAAEAATKLPTGHQAAGKKTKPKGMAAMFGSADGESAGNLSGKVVETMDAGGYSYINLEKNGKQTWVAVPNMKVTVGEEMELEPGAVMTNFTSKSMNKTFESVIFSGGPAHSN